MACYACHSEATGPGTGCAKCSGRRPNVDTASVIYLVLAVLVGGGVAYVLLRRTGKAGVGDVLAQVQDAATIAATLVAAAEQMAESGQITKDARFNYVFTRLRELFPGLSEDILIAAIEGAVWMVNQGIDLLTPDES